MFLHNGRTLNDPQEIANAFNTYFISIGLKLATQINAIHHFTAYLDDPSDRRLKLESIDEATTRKLIEHLKNKTSTGVDCISNKLLKISISELVTPLTIIINQMLNTGIFPKQLKISKVVPIYKANDLKLLTNYRPITLLPPISNIFEYAILEQLSNYFLRNKLFAPQQFGFRAKHSTELAALNLVDYLTYKLDAGQIPANIKIDLSKAFDTLSHSIQLHKLSYYTVKGIAYSLIQSYLTQRQQIVKYNGCKSEKMLITTEVLQGSVLGLFLFLICINDLPLCSKIFEMIMYADDTTLYYNIHGFPNIQHLLNTELSKISDWLAANKLSLNVSKKKLMIFHSDKKKCFIQNYL